MMNLDEAYQTLSQSADHRVLRRVPPSFAWQLPAATGDVVRGCVVDCESTGADPAKDEVIELGVLPFDYDKSTGNVVRVYADDVLSAYREPSIPISEGSQKIHGISAEMVAGKVITHEQIEAAVGGAQIIIAHHAGFDRVMLERLDPLFESKNWACSFQEIDWEAESFEGSKLKYLLTSSGWFHDGHRALSDCEALLWLLTLPLPNSGRTGLAALLEHSRKPQWLVRTEKTVFDHRDLLKQRSYHWEADRKAWTCMTSDPTAELEWLKTSPCWAANWSKVEVISVPPKLRFSARVGGS